MTLRLTTAALLAALPILAVPAFAQADDPAEPAPTENAPVEKDDEAETEAEAGERKICKRIMAQAGSRRTTKVCKTLEEWKAYQVEERNRAGRRN